MIKEQCHEDCDLHQQSFFLDRGEGLLGKRQEEQRVLKDGARLLQETITSCDGKVCYPIYIFSVEEVLDAIKDFYDESDYHNFYMGTYEGRKIFVKKSVHGRNLAFNEIVTVTQINHRNVVKLLGCFEMESPILVYELLPNTLSELLYLENSLHPLSWENRLRIAIEIADAVTYLHTANHRPIVHRDISTNHILLDEQYRPKLCGFTLAIKIPLGETYVEAPIVGKSGYVDPEYLATNVVTEKTDVYNFGWLLLELLSGMKLCKMTELEGVELEDFAKDELGREKILKLIWEASLSIDAGKVEQSMAWIELACRCIALEAARRPTMKEVAKELRRISIHKFSPPSSAQ